MPDTTLISVSSSMSKMLEHRRANLRHLNAQFGGPASLSRRLGYQNASYLVSMTGPHPKRDVVEKRARAIEQALGLRDGDLDMPPEDFVTYFATVGKSVKAGLPAPAVNGRKAQVPAAPVAPAVQPTPASDNDQITREAVVIASKMCEIEHVALPPLRFAEIVMLGITDAREHENQVREDFIHTLVKLVKV